MKQGFHRKRLVHQFMVEINLLPGFFQFSTTIYSILFIIEFIPFKRALWHFILISHWFYVFVPFMNLSRSCDKGRILKKKLPTNFPCIYVIWAEFITLTTVYPWFCKSNKDTGLVAMP